MVTLTSGVRDVIGIVSKDSEDMVCTEVGLVVLPVVLPPVALMNVVDDVNRSARDDGSPDVGGYVEDMAGKSGKKVGLLELELKSSLFR